MLGGATVHLLIRRYIEQLLLYLQIDFLQNVVVLDKKLYYRIEKIVTVIKIKYRILKNFYFYESFSKLQKYIFFFNIFVRDEKIVTENKSITITKIIH